MNEVMPEMPIIADCEAYMKDIINSKETQDGDETINIEEIPAGNISKHIPHSIVLMVLDHNLDKVEYEMIFGEDVAHTFLDKVSEMIGKY